MGYDDRREIFERLEDLERLVRSHGEGRGSGGDRRRERHRDDCDHHHGHRHGHGHDRDRDCESDHGDFDEKRVIDTIVRLVTENVARMVQEHQGRSEHREDGGGEKRIVDLVVGLVSEHVQEIVATELDRRFGPCDAKPASTPPAPPDVPKPEQS